MKTRIGICASLLMLVLLMSCCAPATADNSGTFGTLRWKLDNQGTLTVSGRGRMDGYTQSWDDLKPSIRKVILSDGVLGIGSDTFSDCTNLKSVTIADSVTKIDAFAFDNCTSLKEVVFGKGLVSIGMYAFSSCGLRSVSLPDSVSFIGSNAFQNCTDLNSVKLPERLATISENMFQYCSSLTSIEIPSGVAVIDNSAFYDCGQLQSVTIPASVTFIEQFAFMGCSRLKDIYFKGTKSQWDQLTATTDFMPAGNQDVTVHCGSGGMSFSGLSGLSSDSGTSDSSSSSSFLDTLSSWLNISVSDKITYSKGLTTVTWTDSGNNAPYSVAFRCLDGSAKQSGFWAGGNEYSSTTRSKSFTIDQLIPGHSYEISVYDNNDNVGTGTVSIPAANKFRDDNFTAGKVDVDISYRYVNESGSKKTAGVFVLDQMKPYLNKSSGGCALYYQAIFPGTSETKTYLLQIAITAPNGYIETVVCDHDMTINKSTYGYRFYWDCIGTGFFNNLMEKNGSIPVGDYKVELYMDGMLVNASTFKVKK